MPTYSEPSLAILLLNLVLVTHPVPVPAPEGSRVVNTDGVDTLDFETSTLKAVDDESERSASVGTREDVLVHEQTPDQVLILPRLAETSNLQEENTIVIEHIVDLRQESAEVTNTNMLGHLETGNLLVATLDARSITVVGAQDATLVFLNTGNAETFVTPSSLITTKSDTSDVGAVVNRGVLSEGTPTAAKIKDLVTGLNTDLLTNDGQLVILQFFESLLLVDVTNDTGSVDHAGAKEPSIEVITTVVVVADLLFIYSIISNSPFKMA